MKKLMVLVLALALALSMVVCAAAEEETAVEEITNEVITEEAAASDEEVFAYLNDEQTVLTVNLPVEDGYEWRYEISDTTMLELITEETNNGEFAASFQGLFVSGNVSLNLIYANDEGVDTKMGINMFINEANLIQFTSITNYDYEPDWCETANDDTLIVRVEENASTGYSWSTEIADESLVVIDSSESVAGENEDGLLGVPGEFVIRFSCLSDVVGSTTITMTYAGPDGTVAETRTIEVAVDSGVLTVIEGGITYPAEEE